MTRVVAPSCQVPLVAVKSLPVNRSQCQEVQHSHSCISLLSRKARSGDRTERGDGIKSPSALDLLTSVFGRNSL